MDKATIWQGRLHAWQHWWQQGMLILLPTALRRLGGAPAQILLEVNEQQLLLRILSTDRRSIIEQFQISLAGEPRLHERLLEKTRKACREGSELLLLLPAACVLRKQLQLPQAAEQDLRGALGFEMDRQTPFRQEQVYYDYRVLSRNRPNNKLEVELIALPRADLDARLNQLGTLKLHPRTVDLRDAHGLPAGYNLLPGELRQTSARPSQRAGSALLAALSVILLLASLYAPLLRQELQLRQLAQELNQSRQNLATIAEWQRQRDTLLLRARFLAEKRSVQPTTISLLHELTLLLQDDSWLERLTRKKGTLQLQGQAQNPSSLIRTIESSRHFSQARFRSPVTHDDLTGRDRFHIEVALEDKS